MSAKFSSLSNHLLEETQLLAEEKWIIDTLNKIKAQKNSLQIERLNLESIRNQLKNDKKQSGAVNPPKEITAQDATPSVSAVDLMKSTKAQSNSKLIEFEVPIWEQAKYNEQELNLTVTNPLLSTICSSKQHLEFDSMMSEEEDDDDVVMDMNMLMDASQ